MESRESLQGNMSDYVYGIRATIEAIKAGKEINKILVQKGLNNPLFNELNELIKEHKVPVQNVPIQKLDKINRNNHQGIVAMMSPISYWDVGDLTHELIESGISPLISILI